MLNLFDWLQATHTSFTSTHSILHRERFSSNIIPCFLSLCIFVYLYISWMLLICEVTRAQSAGKNLYGIEHERSQGYLWCQVFKREWKLDNRNYRPLLHKPWPVYVWGWEQDICLSDGKLYWRTFIHMFISLLLLQSLNIFSPEPKLFLRKLSNSIQCDDLRKNGCLNDSHTSSFCSCVMNEAHCGGYYELWYGEMQ